MSTAQNPRLNIFDMIHKALRAMLYDAALAVQQTDFENEQEMHAAFCKIQQALDAFDHHAHHEDQFIIPAVAKYDAQVAAMIEGEHGKDEQLSYELESKMEAFRFAAQPEIKAEIAREILYLFVEFTAFNLSHMNKEEHFLNEVLWKNYTDDELHAINMAIVQSIPQDEMMQSLTWMMRGVSTMKLIQLMSIQKKVMPSQAFESLCETAEKIVDPGRWTKTRAALNEELISA